MAQNPKRTFTKVNLKRELFGPFKRIENASEAFDNNLVFPKPVEYADIDKAVLGFVKDRINLMADGKKAPTFTLFSNQRFSEYSQTWQHTDEEGNLLMDFKTVNRNPNPIWGNNQGGLYNIPGDRRYTVQIKEVLDDNGTESYEVYSMPQPLSVDLQYTVNFVTSDWDKLNSFNTQLNSLFSSIQCYIKPNGWYMPMKLDSIDDQTEYAVDNRKIYIQSASILVEGIVVPEDSYKIEKFPKRVFMSDGYGTYKNRANVDVEGEGADTIITIDFRPFVEKVEFVFDDNVFISQVSTENIRDYTIKVGDERVEKPSEGFFINNCDSVRIKINPTDSKFACRMTLQA